MALAAVARRSITQQSLAVPRAILAPSAVVAGRGISRLNQIRSFHESSRDGLPAGGFLGSGGSAPPTYFQRPALPMNTVIRFVPQQTAWIVERMGRFNRILEPGLAILVPFLDRISYVKSLKEVAVEIPSQSAITADNVTLELDGVLFTRVFDAYKARLVEPFLLTSFSSLLERVADLQYSRMI
jgi:hypothetical protein